MDPPVAGDDRAADPAWAGSVGRHVTARDAPGNRRGAAGDADGVAARGPVRPLFAVMTCLAAARALAGQSRWDRQVDARLAQAAATPRADHPSGGGPRTGP